MREQTDDILALDGVVTDEDYSREEALDDDGSIVAVCSLPFVLRFLLPPDDEPPPAA